MEHFIRLAFKSMWFYRYCMVTMIKCTKEGGARQNFFVPQFVQGGLNCAHPCMQGLTFMRTKSNLSLFIFQQIFITPFLGLCCYHSCHKNKGRYAYVDPFKYLINGILRPMLSMIRMKILLHAFFLEIFGSCRLRINCVLQIQTQLFCISLF